MQRVRFTAPAGWSQPDVHVTDYVVADGLRATISEVRGLPEDEPGWLGVEIERRAAGAGVGPIAISRVTLAAGWPATIGEADVGDRKMMLVLYRFLERAAVASLDGPAAVYAEHRAVVLEAFLAADIDWGDGPMSIARLLDGANR